LIGNQWRWQVTDKHEWLGTHTRAPDESLDGWARVCRAQAERNLAKWGPQDWETLGLAIAEETGELAQAILKCLHEGGPRDRIQEEAVDLGALCLQVLQGFSAPNSVISVRKDNQGHSSEKN